MDMNDICTQVEYPRALALIAGDTVKIITIRDGVETVHVDATVPAGKTFSGSARLSGQLA